MRVDDAGGHDHAPRQSEIAGRRRSQHARRRAQRQDPLRQPGTEIGQADGTQHRLGKAALVRQVVPLAGQRANAGRVGTATAPDQVVGQVEEPRRRPIAVRAMPLQPQDLGQLHLDADFAADVGERRVAGRVDRRRLVGRAVVHPHDDVALRIAVLGDRDGPAVHANSDQRAGGVEAEGRDGIDRHAGQRHRFAHRRTGLAPDVGRRLLGEIGPRMKLPDGSHGEGEASTRVVVEAGTHARRSHVDADVDLAADHLLSRAGFAALADARFLD